MPKGQPQTMIRVLDHTHTWGRTLGEGALFCFVAEGRIPADTHKKGLQDALRASSLPEAILPMIGI